MGPRAERLVNTGLRGITLGARFIFIFFLAKYLDAASVGYYGLFTATVGFALYLVGLDFYTYSTREVLKAPNEKRGTLLKSQAALASGLYLMLLPLIWMLLQHAAWPAALVMWFFPILLLEHLNQELSRLLIALSEQITASVILFVRQATWALAIAALMTWQSTSRELPYVMAGWAMAGVAAALLGLWKLRRLQFGGWGGRVDWRWIRKGIMVSGAFLLATLALRGIQTIDRFWLETLTNIEFVGAYVLFFGVAATLLTFLDAGVFAFTYPELIKHHHLGQHEVARRKVRTMVLHTVVLSGGFGVISWSLLPYLLEWIGNPIYFRAVNIYPWVLLAMILNAFSMIPHYGLYAMGRDMPIISSHFVGLAAFVLSVWAVSHFSTTLAVPVGLSISFAVILVWKSVAYLIESSAVANSESLPQNS